MTQDDAAAADAPHDDAPLVVPPGVPLRVWDWLLPPLFVVVPAVALVWVPLVQSLKPYAIATGSIVVVIALAQWVFGFRAFMRWDDVDVRWLRRSETAGSAAFAIFTAPYLYGMPSAWLFATAAYRLAADPGTAVARVRSALSPRGWIRLKIIAAVVGIIGLVVHPLAAAFGLGVAAWILASASAIAFGFALRAQPAANEPLPPRNHRRP